MPIRDHNIASNAAIAASKLDLASTITSSMLSTGLRTGYINLNIADARLVGSTSGEAWANATGAAGPGPSGRLSSASVPAYTVNSTLARVGRLVFSSGTSAFVQFAPIPIPPDMSTAGAMTVHAIGGSGASTDAGPLFRYHFYANAGSSQAPVDLVMSTAAASTVAREVSATVPSSQLSSHPGVLTVTMQSISTQDQMYCHGTWLEYARV